MASKLPKPSGSKLPQIAPKPLGTISENVGSRIADSRELKRHAHEAPPSTSLFHRPARLARRSKSVTDLRGAGAVDKPLTGLGPLRTARIENKPIVQTKAALSHKGAKTAPVKVNATGTKRPLVNKSDEGVSKPKVLKKIPDWDYKSRFNQLNERYQQVQECLTKVETKVAEYDDVKRDFANLKTVHENLEIECRTHVENIQRLEAECTANTEEVRAIKTLNEKLIITNEELLEQKKSLELELASVKQTSHFFTAENRKLLQELGEVYKEKENLKLQVSTQLTDLQRFNDERRVLHNTIQDLKGNIRVFCRVRPSLISESGKSICLINFTSEKTLEIRKSQEEISRITGKSQECKSDFSFDRVFSDGSTQEEVFEELAQLVQSALDGYHVCVFAYGQTGSGKTYTMQGGEAGDQGMIPRTSRLIFENIAKLEARGFEYTVQASFLEIYNENVRDLLHMNNSQKLEICHNEGKETTVSNLTKQTMKSASELETYMRRAHRNRATATTNFNTHSSRSHAVTKIYLEGTLKDSNTIYSGSLNLVDLAGSENAKQSVAGERLTETKHINRSLSTLGDVIYALHSKASHVPYRNSKLTYLLQSCLGGNSKTLMIVNVAPFDESYGETINSLRFATKVKEVKTASKKNKVMVPQLVKQKTPSIG